jgi:hypothetical protein
MTGRFVSRRLDQFHQGIPRMMATRKSHSDSLIGIMEKFSEPLRVQRVHKTGRCVLNGCDHNAYAVKVAVRKRSCTLGKFHAGLALRRKRVL